MDSHGLKRISKKLSLVLRHNPDAIGIRLDEAGWVDVDVLLAALRASGMRVSPQLLAQVVTDNDKKRFTIAGGRIRANQGHSVGVDLGLQPLVPPPVLFHGTATANIASILSVGLRRGNRHHVHLSKDTATARTVGARHGTPVVFTVDAKAMHDKGHVFFCSANGVWLTEAVPPAHLRQAT